MITVPQYAYKNHIALPEDDMDQDLNEMVLHSML